jgi:ubiquinone/menaquinone biosynthesis C-methylase UbiE
MSAKQLTWEEAVQWLRDQPGQESLAQACYYDDPIQTAAERFSNSEEWQAVTELLTDHIPGKVLDIGAGRGISSYAFAKAGCHVIALEPDPSLLVGAGAIRSLTTATHVPIDIVQSYGETLSFDSNTFDIIYGRAVLHHARDLPQLCKEVARVLKPGGVFIATREHVISQRQDLDQFLNGHALHKLYGGENAFLLSEYIDAITGANLKLDKTIAPSGSVINYAPKTITDFQTQTTQALARFVGGPLSQLGFLQNLYLTYRDNKSNIPGRHYSFIGVKP